jgi:tetratricopeptide (TPR) repeat protein
MLSAVRVTPDFCGSFTRGIAVAVVLSLMAPLAGGGESPKPFELGRRALSRGDWDEALAQFDNAARGEPGDPAVYYGRAYAYGMKGDLGKAITDYNKAISLGPSNGDAYYGRGWAYSKAGHAGRAVADYTEAIRLSPGAANAYYCRGIIYWKEGEKAAAGLAGAARPNPNLPEAGDGRGRTGAANGDFEKAIADLDAAIRLSPRWPCCYEARGAILVSRGNYDRGIADLQTAIRLDPNDPAAKFEAWPKGPTDSAAIHRGEGQVRKMLRDRPAMAAFGERAAVLYEWAARKFAGEDGREEILWDASEPAFNAENLAPSGAGPGCIRIRGQYRDGPDKGKERPFEEMWRDTVCELYNVGNAQDFQRTAERAAAGELTKAGFATRMIEIESGAAEKARAFYIPRCQVSIATL